MFGRSFLSRMFTGGRRIMTARGVQDYPESIRGPAFAVMQSSALSSIRDRILGGEAPSPSDFPGVEAAAGRVAAALEADPYLLAEVERIREEAAASRPSGFAAALPVIGAFAGGVAALGAASRARAAAPSPSAGGIGTQVGGLADVAGMLSGPTGALAAATPETVNPYALLTGAGGAVPGGAFAAAPVPQASGAALWSNPYWQYARQAMQPVRAPVGYAYRPASSMFPGGWYRQPVFQGYGGYSVPWWLRYR